MKLAADKTDLGIEPLPENLFREPIDFLYADHFRLRAICNLLEQLACDTTNDAPARLASAIVRYMERELPLHIADEDEDLLPALRSRCEPADGVDAAVSILQDAHRNELELQNNVLPHLRRIADGAPRGRSSALRHRFIEVAENMRRHLDWEERHILPLARQRLVRADMEAIGRRMAARRGVDYPEL